MHPEFLLNAFVYGTAYDSHYFNNTKFSKKTQPKISPAIGISRFFEVKINKFLDGI